MLMLGSAVSNQSGAAIGALAFPIVGPIGVVAIRQWIAGVLLLAIARPAIRSFTRRQWELVLALAVVFATMNLSVYMAIERIGLGTAVTLEFLGPLVIALRGSLTAPASGAGRRVTLACTGFATAGILLLVRPEPTTDYLGAGLALLAAACWAIYILLNRAAGQRFTGVQGPAAAGAVSALLYIPIGAVVLSNNPPTLVALACGVAAGVLASVIPFVADLDALRYVPAHVFGIVMSVNPVFAAAIGALVLGDVLGADDWAAICLIVAANAGAVLAGHADRQTQTGGTVAAVTNAEQRASGAGEGPHDQPRGSACARR